jgi:hypothetical protein
MVRMTGAAAVFRPLCVSDVTLPWYEVAMVAVSLRRSQFAPTRDATAPFPKKIAIRPDAKTDGGTGHVAN